MASRECPRFPGVKTIYHVVITRDAEDRLKYNAKARQGAVPADMLAVGISNGRFYHPIFRLTTIIRTYNARNVAITEHDNQPTASYAPRIGNK